MDVQYYFQYFPLVFINWLVTFITLNIGVFVWFKGKKDKVTLLVAVSIILVSIQVFLGSIQSYPVNEKTYNTVMRISWPPILLAHVSIYFATILLFEKYGYVLKLQRILFKFIVIPLFLALSFLTAFTEVFFSSRMVPQWEEVITTWNIKFYGSLIVIPVAQVSITILFVFNTYRLWQINYGKRYLKKRFLIVFLSALIAGFASCFAVVGNYLVDMDIIQGNDIRFAIYNLTFLISTIVLVFSMTEYNTLTYEGSSLSREFIRFFIKSSILTFVYIVPIVLFLYFMEWRDSLIIITTILIAAPTITHNFIDQLDKFIGWLLRDKTNTITLINNSSINYALKNLNKPSFLNKSELTKLEAVKLNCKKNEITKTESLRELFKEVLNMMKQVKNRSERNKLTLKYEILRMIIEEEALESQILWNLGFETNSKIINNENPKYTIKKNSEYRATSIMSYRRLKKAAINDFRWKLTQLEKQVLRLK